MTARILPGATLGMLGGGQLGRMFTIAALNMGYRVIVLDPDPLSPAGQLASDHLCAGYDDQTALDDLADRCAAVSTEFENVPAASLRRLAARLPVRPGAEAVEIAQDRLREKTFARRAGLATARFREVRAPQDIAPAWAAMRGAAAILKTARLGYDGKGQALCHSEHAVHEAFATFGMLPCVLEQRVDLALEVSVLLARGADGAISCFPPAENSHADGILDVSCVPARIEPGVARRATQMATALAEALDYVGVLAVELFLTEDDELLVNEIAPRPHNSGHYSLDATACSQFEQQVRMLCGLPAGDVRLLSPVAMVNLLGDLWGDSAPRWEALLENPAARLHLYGKAEARPGRKMGHFNLLAADVDAAVAAALAIKRELRRD